MVLLAIIKFLVNLWTVLTLPVYYLIYKPKSKLEGFRRQRAEIVKVGQDEVTYRALPKPSQIQEIFEEKNVTTMDDVWKFMVQLYGDKKCLGTRKILQEGKVEGPNGKPMIKLNMEDFYSWKNYDDVDQQSTYFGR